MHARTSAWEFLHFRDKIAIRDSPYNESAVAQSLLAVLLGSPTTIIGSPITKKTCHPERSEGPAFLFRCATLGSSAWVLELNPTDKTQAKKTALSFFRGSELQLRHQETRRSGFSP